MTPRALVERDGSRPGRLIAVTEPPDPRRVRFWGWVAFFVAVAIALTFLLLQQPWHKG